MITCNTIALMLMIGSYHFSPMGNHYNNFNPGVVGQCSNVEAGIYYNSEKRVSTFVDYRGDWWKVGLVTGYARQKIMPGFTVYHDWEHSEVNVAPFIETWNGESHDVGIVVNYALRWTL